MKVAELFEAAKFRDYGGDRSTEIGFDLHMMGLALKHLDVKEVSITDSHVWVKPHSIGRNPETEIYVNHQDTTRARGMVEEGGWLIEVHPRRFPPTAYYLASFDEAVEKMEALVKAHNEDK